MFIIAATATFTAATTVTVAVHSNCTVVVYSVVVAADFEGVFIDHKCIIALVAIMLSSLFNIVYSPSLSLSLSLSLIVLYGDLLLVCLGGRMRADLIFPLSFFFYC